MKRRIVEISQEARGDLFALYDWIAESGSPDTALTYVGRIEAFCKGLDLASERGHSRDDVRPGLRIVGFERRVTIAFMVEDTRVVVLRVFYGGRNWTELMQ